MAYKGPKYNESRKAYMRRKAIDEIRTKGRLKKEFLDMLGPFAPRDTPKGTLLERITGVRGGNPEGVDDIPRVVANTRKRQERLLKEERESIQKQKEKEDSDYRKGKAELRDMGVLLPFLDNKKELGDLVPPNVDFTKRQSLPVDEIEEYRMKQLLGERANDPKAIQKFKDYIAKDRKSKELIPLAPLQFQIPPRPETVEIRPQDAGPKGLFDQDTNLYGIGTTEEQQERMQEKNTAPIGVTTPSGGGFNPEYSFLNMLYLPQKLLPRASATTMRRDYQAKAPPRHPLSAAQAHELGHAISTQDFTLPGSIVQDVVNTFTNGSGDLPKNRQIDVESWFGKRPDEGKGYHAVQEWDQNKKRIDYLNDRDERLQYSSVPTKMAFRNIMGTVPVDKKEFDKMIKEINSSPKLKTQILMEAIRLMKPVYQMSNTPMRNQILEDSLQDDFKLLLDGDKDTVNDFLRAAKGDVPDDGTRMA